MGPGLREFGRQVQDRCRGRDHALRLGALRPPPEVQVRSDEGIRRIPGGTTAEPEGEAVEQEVRPVQGPGREPPAAVRTFEQERGGRRRADGYRQDAQARAPWRSPSRGWPARRLLPGPPRPGRWRATGRRSCISSYRGPSDETIRPGPSKHPALVTLHFPGSLCRAGRAGRAGLRPAQPALRNAEQPCPGA